MKTAPKKSPPKGKKSSAAVQEPKMIAKAMISQPMRGLTNAEIEAARARAAAVLEKGGFYVVNTYFKRSFARLKKDPGAYVHLPLVMLSKSLRAMAQCEAVYFCDGFEDSPGCLVELVAAINYGVDCLFEDKGVEKVVRDILEEHYGITLMNRAKKTKKTKRA